MSRAPGRGTRGRPAAPSVRSVNYATSPLLASKTPPWRSRFLVAMVGAAFLLLLGRAVWVQIIETGFYQKQGDRRFVHTLELPASRGRILDRNGVVLATSVPAPSVWALPKDFEADAAQRKALAGLLGMTRSELQSRLDGNPNFVWLRRQVDDSVWARAKALGIKGLYEVREYKREYPEGAAAAHVVGFTNFEEKGQEGIELAYQKQLQGRPGTRTVVKDRLGRVIEDVGEQVDAVNGQDIQLSIDSKVQFFAYQRLRDAVVAHGAKGGSAVVLDARTGEVLAMANYPSYDPSNRRNLEGGVLRNRAVTDTFEPGSTMKPFTVSLALQNHLVTPDTLIDTGNGRITITGSTISDSHPNGVISVSQVIQKSSNVGTVKMALRLQPRQMWDVFTAVGIGQKPQIDFPGVVTGRLRPYKTWRPIEQATMAYGYGLSVSLLQLAHAYTVFTRDGEVIPVTMHKLDGPPAGVRVYTPQVAAEMRAMLHLVTLPGGTATQAQAIGYSVGGKTGTAYKQEGKGYDQHKYRSWFVGIAPISDPRLIVAVMVDEPSKGSYFGGDVAGPVFSEVVQNTLRMMGVPPDIPVQDQIVARTATPARESP